ncbi:T9SS type A sorting domain-containing protein [Aequorivita sinensis]|uniref:T9SS type A sorting domain-containing protein n=1 Tax=Aequorivita sinensis TaxID=1382458 RepID=UPI002301D6E9|nr:T9SS type A sorting domain-containing protein [Aequorivita sinensis]
MKTIIFFLISSLISFSSYAQDPQLFENDWYLYEVLSMDFGTQYNVALINPSIFPYISISENYNFNGVGACNIFNGTFEPLSADEFTATSFNPTTEDCGNQEHNGFEDEYFSFISGSFWYNITTDTEGKVLTMQNPFFGYALFKSYPLTTSDYRQNKFQIFPNPVNEVLVLNGTKNIGRLKTQVYSTEGKILNTQHIDFNKQTSIDVSNLSSGIYFLNIEDQSGRVEVKKFIKQ